MAAPERFDVAIIGTGQGGKPLAQSLGEAGRSVAVIERGHVGGTCINVGCTPTKTMVASARVAYLARRASEYGVDTGRVAVDLRQVMARKHAVVSSFRDGSRRSLEETRGVELLLGEARFQGPRTLSVAMRAGGTRTLAAETIVINTGARPAMPPLAGLAQVDALDSSSILELEVLPEHLLVLGGGYVGLEFAQMFRRFGSRVTIVQRGDQLLGREDEDVAAEVADILRAEDIEVLLDTAALRVAREKQGIRLDVRTDDRERVLGGSHLLVATGRTPNTDVLDLPRAGVETDRAGYVRVDSMLATTAPGIHAIGDVKGGPQFTHVSYDDFRILEKNLLRLPAEGDGKRATTEGRLVPYTVFIDPQLGRVGLSAREAREAGRRVRVAKLPMESVARAIELSETRGFLKVVVDADTERILGCAALGVEGGEIANMLQIAMLGGLPYTALRDGVFPHPTLGEALNTLFYAFEE